MFPKFNRTLLNHCFQLLTRQQIIRKYVEITAEPMVPKTRKLILVKREVPENVCNNDVLVQVHYAGLCGTDVNIIDGNFPSKDTEPLVLGHEFAGVVTKTGKTITHVKVGDKVVVNPIRGCNMCDHCLHGNPHYCKNGGLNVFSGMFFDGGWRQYALAPYTQIHKVPDSLTLEQATLCEPTSCVSHVWDKMIQSGPVPIRSRILIISAGILGNLFASVLHLQGHRRVTILEQSFERLKIFSKLNTGYDLLTPNCLKSRQERDPKYLFDLMIDCTGNVQAIENSVTLMDYGGKIYIIGVPNKNVPSTLCPFGVIQKRLSIYRAVINPFNYPKALCLLEIMGERYIDFEKLGVKTFSINQFPEAIEQLKKRSIAKVTFKMIPEDVLPVPQNIKTIIT